MSEAESIITEQADLSAAAKQTADRPNPAGRQQSINIKRGWREANQGLLGLDQTELTRTKCAGGVCAVDWKPIRRVA